MPGSRFGPFTGKQAISLDRLRAEKAAHMVSETSQAQATAPGASAANRMALSRHSPNSGNASRAHRSFFLSCGQFMGAQRCQMIACKALQASRCTSFSTDI